MATVREVTPQDADALRRLVQELADYERMPDGPEVSSEQLAEHIASKAVHGIVAERGSDLVGMCLYYFAYSTWQGPYIHMEDLYVSPTARRLGIGRRLWAELAKVALRHNVKRLQWNVLDWNKPALEFYETMPCSNLTRTEGWWLYRMEPKDMEHLARHADPKSS